MLGIKADHVVAIDDVTRTAEEFGERISALLEFNLNDQVLIKTIALCRERILSASAQLAGRIRAQGNLPEAGSVELPQLGAVKLRVKTMLSADAEASVVAEELSGHGQKLIECIEEAAKLTAENAELAESLASLKTTALQVRRLLEDLR